MKKIMFIVVLLILSSCDSNNGFQVSEFKCDDMQSVREYTLKCISAAGHGGESEPEDWLWRCEQLAKEMYCEEKAYYVKYGEKDGIRQVISKVEVNSYKTMEPQ